MLLGEELHKPAAFATRLRSTCLIDSIARWNRKRLHLVGYNFEAMMPKQSVFNLHYSRHRACAHECFQSEMHGSDLSPDRCVVETPVQRLA